MISGLLSLAGAAVLVVIDQLIKHWATAALLPVGSMDVLPGIVELRYCLNDGILRTNSMIRTASSMTDVMPMSNPCLPASIENAMPSFRQ